MPPEDPTSPSSRFRLPFIGTSIAAILVVGVLAVAYSQYVQTSVIKPSASPIRIRVGQTHTVKYKTSARAPSVKIVICQRKGLRNCTTLASNARGQQTAVNLPAQYPAG